MISPWKRPYVGQMRSYIDRSTPRAALGTVKKSAFDIDETMTISRRGEGEGERGADSEG